MEERTPLFAWEFFAFLGLAAWLFYTQFLGPWLRGDRRGTEAPREERRAEDPAEGKG